VIGQAEEEPPSGSGPAEGRILLLFVVLTLAAGALVLAREESDAVSDPAAKAARGEVTGLGELSLLREANLSRLLAKVDAGSYPIVSNLRVAPQRADVTAADSEGTQKILSVDPGLGVEERDFGTASGTGGLRAAKIDARGPERMLRAVARRTERPVGDVDYVTMSFLGSGEPEWYLALSGGPPRDRSWLAAADGSDLRRSGELAPSVQAENERRQRRLERQQRGVQRRFERRTECLRRARDAAGAARCIERFPP